MGLPAARDPADWEESRTSARRGNEIRERESCTRTCLVGPGLAARASRTPGPREPAGGRRRAGQTAAGRCPGTLLPLRNARRRRRVRIYKRVTDWATDFDFLDSEWIENPYPIWDALRSKFPISHTDSFMGVYLPPRDADLRAI